MGVVDRVKIEQWIDNPRGPIAKQMLRLARETEKTAVILSKISFGRHPMDQRRTGLLARSFRVQPDRGPGSRPSSRRVANIARYFRPLEVGARPHIIRARRVKHLHFRDRRGNWRRVKQVRHPGNRAYEILSRSLFITAQRNLANVRRFTGRQLP